MDEQERWRDLQCLLNRPGNLTGPNFEPDPELLQFLQACYASPPLSKAERLGPRPRTISSLEGLAPTSSIAVAAWMARHTVPLHVVTPHA